MPGGSGKYNPDVARISSAVTLFPTRRPTQPHQGCRIETRTGLAACRHFRGAPHRSFIYQHYPSARIVNDDPAGPLGFLSLLQRVNAPRLKSGACPWAVGRMPVPEARGWLTGQPWGGGGCDEHVTHESSPSCNARVSGCRGADRRSCCPRGVPLPVTRPGYAILPRADAKRSQQCQARRRSSPGYIRESPGSFSYEHVYQYQYSRVAPSYATVACSCPASW